MTQRCNICRRSTPDEDFERFSRCGLTGVRLLHDECGEDCRAYIAKGREVARIHLTVWMDRFDVLRAVDDDGKCGPLAFRDSLCEDDRKDFAFVVACLKVDIPLPEDPPTIEAIA